MGLASGSEKGTGFETLASFADGLANASKRPFAAFKIGPMSGREARESGLWLNARRMRLHRSLSSLAADDRERSGGP
jgi:hypothetical protein